jgi:hypothetical protein
MSQCYCEDCQKIDYCHSSKIELMRTALEEIIALHDNESTDTTCCKMTQIAWEALKDEAGQ